MAEAGRAALQTEEDRCGGEDGVPHRARADRHSP